MTTTEGAALASLTIAAAAVGFALGRASVPGGDLDYIINADRVRQAQVSQCVKGFEDALTLYKNTTQATLAQLKSEHEDDLRLMRLATAGCDASRAAH